MKKKKKNHGWRQCDNSRSGHWAGPTAASCRRPCDRYRSGRHITVPLLPLAATSDAPILIGNKTSFKDWFSIITIVGINIRWSNFRLPFWSRITAQCAQRSRCRGCSGGSRLTWSCPAETRTSSTRGGGIRTRYGAIRDGSGCHFHGSIRNTICEFKNYSWLLEKYLRFVKNILTNFKSIHAFQNYS